jgi:hypothetical protein
MSAVFAAATVAVLGLWVRAHLRDRYDSVTALIIAAATGAASLSLAVSRLFWSQAVIAEVYTLNAFLVTTSWYLVWRWDQNQGQGHRPLIWAAGIYGLAIGHHPTALLCLPGLAYYVYTSPHRLSIGRRQILAGLSFTLLSFSLYAYLPLRAQANPFPNWGNPTTWDRFFWLVSGRLYSHYVFALPLSHWPLRLATWAGDLSRQFGPWGVALGLIGLWVLAQTARRSLLALLTSFGLYSLYAIGYNTGDSFVYLIPAYVIWSFFLGTGVLGALDWLGIDLLTPPTRKTWTAAVLLILLTLSPLLWNWPVLDLSDDHQVPSYIDQTLLQLPEQAILISASDAHTFALWYAQHVKRLRPDVLVLDRDLLPYGWYRSQVLANEPNLAVPSQVDDRARWLTRFLDANLSTRSIWLTDLDERLNTRYQIQGEGLLYHLHSP